MSDSSATRLCESCRTDRDTDMLIHERGGIDVCRYCRGVDITDVESVFGRSSAWARDKHGATKVTSTEYVMGTDPAGRVVTVDNINNQFGIYVPRHGDVTQYPSLAELRDSGRHVRSIRYTDAKPEPGPIHDGGFITTADNDHLIQVDRINERPGGYIDGEDAVVAIVRRLTERFGEPWQQLTGQTMTLLERNDADELGADVAIVNRDD